MVDGQCPFWELRTDAPHDDATRHSASARLIGTLPYGNDVAVTLGATTAGMEIVFSDTGRFTFDVHAQRITHRATHAVDRAAVALDLIGVLLPFALHQRGAWCVHASAIETRDGVVAFMAPRGTGKSTLAAACVQRGCALVADDVVVLRPDAHHGVTVTPTGLPLRLRADAARAIGASTEDDMVWGKVRVRGALSVGAQALVACYVLAAVPPEREVTRAPRDTRAAAIALLTNGKIAELLGAEATGDALTRCIDIARRVPVFDLAVPRAISALERVTEQLLAWHGGPSARVPASA